ncbi:hypothetical protein FBU30_003678 [Linnemannia zychae]|nr:hypothetical protein FBU30_003678 [Linnemannia zychae]
MIASGDYVPLLNNTVINSINIDISSSSSSSVGSSQTSLSTSSIFSSNYNSSNHIVQSLTLSFPTVQKVYVAPVFEMLRSGLGPGITMTEARLLIASMPVLTDLGLISSAGCVEVNLLQQEYPYLKIQQ